LKPPPNPDPPIRCRAKFSAKCHNCGEPIEVGDPQWYAPGVKLVSHDGADPWECGPPIDAPRAVKQAPFRAEYSADMEWRLGKLCAQLNASE
jgi:hypothetical protein